MFREKYIYKNKSAPGALGDNLPFRPGVGMMIINHKKEVFMGKRIDSKINGWQMPQGGIDPGETPSVAALREMEEEIGTCNGYIIAESRNWYSYRIPKVQMSKLWNGKYCGQKQKWFLIYFAGSDSEIDLNSQHPEFETWKWYALEEVMNKVIPFKHKLYEQVMKEFLFAIQEFVPPT